MTLCLAFLLLTATGTLGSASATRSAISILHADTLAAKQVAANQPASGQGIEKPDKLKGHAKRTGKENPQTLTGIVEWEYKPLAWDCDVPNCDHFAIYDDASHTNYELDDARKALPFEGKRATVTGVVDTKNSVIHLLSIEPTKQ